MAVLGRGRLGLREAWLLQVADTKFMAGMEVWRLEDDGYTGIGRYCILRVFSFRVPLGMNCLQAS